ncbi:hypothetical protein LXL04_032270 [Taraxacum kok-saghyz]
MREARRSTPNEGSAEVDPRNFETQKEKPEKIGKNKVVDTQIFENPKAKTNPMNPIEIDAESGRFQGALELKMKLTNFGGVLGELKCKAEKYMIEFRDAEDRKSNDNPNLKLEAYCDSDRASCPITRRPVSGYYITFGGTPISWKSKKQVTVSLSSAEAEYRSMRRICAELAWLSRLFQDLNVPNITPIPLKCDNQASIYIATNPVFHE